MTGVAVVAFGALLKQGGIGAVPSVGENKKI
jgi:hypothetical protein